MQQLGHPLEDRGDLGVVGRAGHAGDHAEPRSAARSYPAGLRTRLRRPFAALACFATALVLHHGFCEWRTLEHASAAEPEFADRLLLSVRRQLHPSGNAERWDREDRALRAYDAAWRECYREVRGEPEPGGPLARCLAARSYRVTGTTAEAVALAECERELEGGLRAARPIAACLRARGYAEAPIPRWSFERIGRRFDGPYVTQTALYAEDLVADRRANLWIGAGLGVALPALLVAAAVSLALPRGPA